MTDAEMRDRLRRLAYQQRHAPIRAHGMPPFAAGVLAAPFVLFAAWLILALLLQ